MTFYPVTAPARYDTICNGLVPCRVIEIDGPDITVRVTKTRGPYKRGEVIKTLRTHVVPAAAVRERQSGTWIRPYQWVVTSEGVTARVY